MRQQTAHSPNCQGRRVREWVFCDAHGLPLRAGQLVRRSFQPLLAKAGIPHIRFHDLRHSTATLLLTLGVHPKIVQEVLGHSQIFVTLDVYSHILPTLQEEAMHHLNQLLTSPDSQQRRLSEEEPPQA